MSVVYKLVFVVFAIIAVYFVSSAQKVSKNNAQIEHAFQVEAQSNKGIYQASLLCSEALSTGAFQQCSLKLLNKDGAVEKMKVFIDGGMPAHSHGLPTSPKIKWSDVDKTYHIEGLKFSMPGKWVLNFNVNAEEEPQKDTVVMKLEVI